MRTYSARDVEDDINHVGWVPADVARGLYEVLVMLDNDEFSHLSPLAWDRMQAALAAADGEE